MKDILNKIKSLPLGYSEGFYDSKKYGITRADFNNGKSFKVYAEELGGVGFISLNYYITETSDLLKPCEMPKKKVIHFLKNFILKPKSKIAFGGGCHWCTEAVFQSLLGVSKVEQGFVASIDENSEFSEAVIVHFDDAEISLATLIEIHLHTHKSKSNHSMRTKYRSAIYTFTEEQKNAAKSQLELLQFQFQNRLITQVLPFDRFKASREQIQNYYYKNPEKPFCESFINPKLLTLLNKFSKYTDQNKLKHLTDESRETKYSE